MGILGAVAPDFDVFYFFFKDDILYHTHRFYSHYPIVWFSLFLMAVAWMRLDNYNSKTPSLAVIFTLNGFVHLILDTIGGKIYWLARIGTVGEAFGMQQYLLWSSATIELFILFAALCLWNKKLIIRFFKIIAGL